MMTLAVAADVYCSLVAISCAGTSECQIKPVPSTACEHFLCTSSMGKSLTAKWISCGISSSVRF